MGTLRHPIQSLDEAVASQIAAGEVIESPAHIIKELIENSLDAGAKRISIHVEGGGIERIRLVDDGSGIPREELPLAVKRHATSKLRVLNDLFSIRSFGFRGEALAAISSVSVLKIASRQEGHETGYRLTVEHGRLGKIEPCAMPMGTSIEISELFAEVPARRKFLRNEAQEKEKIEQVVRRLAVIHMDVSFELTGTKRKKLLWSGVDSNLKTLNLSPGGMHRLNQLMQAENGMSWYVGRHKYDGCEIECCLPDVRAHRRDRKGIVIIINQRLVDDNRLTDIIRLAARPFMPMGRQPVVLLQMTIDPQQIDVNVHPQKSEVRFENEMAVHNHILASLTKDFSKQGLQHDAIPHRFNGQSVEGRDGDQTEKRLLREDAIEATGYLSVQDQPQTDISEQSPLDWFRNLQSNLQSNRLQPHDILDEQSAQTLTADRPQVQESVAQKQKKHLRLMPHGERWCFVFEEDAVWCLDKKKWALSQLSTEYDNAETIAIRRLLKPIRFESDALSIERCREMALQISRSTEQNCRLDGIPSCFPLGIAGLVLQAVTQIQNDQWRALSTAELKRVLIRNLAELMLQPKQPIRDERWLRHIRVTQNDIDTSHPHWNWVAQSIEMRESESCLVNNFPL